MTFKDIDFVHERAEGTAKRNFNSNKEKFIEKEDFFLIAYSEFSTKFVQNDFKIIESEVKKMETKIKFYINGTEYVLFIEKGFFKTYFQLFEKQKGKNFLIPLPIKVLKSSLREKATDMLIRLEALFRRIHRKNKNIKEIASGKKQFLSK